MLPTLLLGGGGPPFSRQLPKGGPGSGPCWKPHRSGGGRQRQHQLELSWKGVGPHRKVLMGVRDALRHPRPSPPWALIRSKVPTETNAAFHPKSACLEGRMGPLVSGERGMPGNFPPTVLSQQLSKSLLLSNWLMGYEKTAGARWGLCVGRKGEGHNC